MERLKRSSLFWTLLVVAVMLPAGLLATGKRLYWAPIKDDAGAGKGSATVMSQPSGYTYMAATHSLPDFQVTKVWLANRNDDWQIPLCDSTIGGPTEDDCTYKADGNLDIDGPLTGSMFIGAGVSGLDFRNALGAVNADGSSDLKIVIFYGAEARGFFTRII